MLEESIKSSIFRGQNRLIDFHRHRKFENFQTERASADQASHWGHEVRAHQVPCSGEVYQASGPEKGCQRPRAKTLLCCLIGGGATLESFLTSHLCCARCWQTHPTRAHLSGSLACLMPLLERISNVPSGTTLSWQCSLSTTNAMYEALGLCHCCLFSGLVEHCFPREGAK